MSDNPSGMPAAADNPMAAQQPPAPVASTEGVDDTILDDLEDGAAFEGVSKYPNRVKCALLGGMALKGRVTLLFAGHDHVHCHARVLREAILGVEEDLT